MIIVFLALTMMLGCAPSKKEASKTAVLKVLQDHETLEDQHDLNALEQEKDPNKFLGKLEGFVDAIGDIDTGACPPTFRVAFRQYVREIGQVHFVMERIVTSVEKLPKNSFDLFLENELQKEFGASDGAFAHVYNLRETLWKQIQLADEAWDEVEKVAVSYDAAL